MYWDMLKLAKKQSAGVSRVFMERELHSLLSLNPNSASIEEAFTALHSKQQHHNNNKYMTDTLYQNILREFLSFFTPVTLVDIVSKALKKDQVQVQVHRLLYTNCSIDRLEQHAAVCDECE